MKKDPTSIDYCKGMGWAKAGKWLRSNAHMLVLGESVDGLVVAKSFVESGEEAGTAVLAAVLAMRRNGVPASVYVAVKTYEDAAKELARKDNLSKEGRRRVETLRLRTNQLDYYTAFMYRPPRNGKYEWPLMMPEEMWADLNKKCGMANVLMGLAIRELSESTTTEFLAMTEMVRFLKEGLETRRRRRCWGGSGRS
jgi:hypothetical protein